MPNPRPVLGLEPGPEPEMRLKKLSLVPELKKLEHELAPLVHELTLELPLEGGLSGLIVVRTF